MTVVNGPDGLDDDGDLWLKKLVMGQPWWLTASDNDRDGSGVGSGLVWMFGLDTSQLSCVSCQTRLTRSTPESTRVNNRSSMVNSQQSSFGSTTVRFMVRF
ncbi:hypothetical protein HanPSC8_Chr15g0675571 [Helianthus annuus]|nr:hypothetical protein HanPSC8_Chr15g0675571 [Helianthus annuus]